MASLPVSPSLTRTTSATDSTGNLTPTTTDWTSEQETRLAYCQEQLKQAQKKWSDRQELWIREVDHLLELKRAHKKAQKKQKRKARADKAPRKANSKLWRPLSRTQSNIVDTTTTSTAASTPRTNTSTSLNDDDDDDAEDDSLGGVARSESMPQQISASSSPPTPSPTRSTGRNPFKKMIRRMSSASVRGTKGRGISVADAEGSGSRGEG